MTKTRRSKLLWFFGGAGCAILLLLPVIHGYREVGGLRRQLTDFTSRVEQLERSSHPIEISRESVCLIYGETLSKDGARTISFFGTGFIVAEGVLVTNRHVVDPDYAPRATPALASHVRQHTARPLRALRAVFPGVRESIPLTLARTSADSDLALLRYRATAQLASLRPVRLSARKPGIGDPVTLVGFPLAIDGMLAKAPAEVFRSARLEHDDAKVIDRLAHLSLVRPTSTVGHVGDIVGTTMVLDASTTHGGSGAPIFDRAGEVIGITSGMLRNFAGSAVGVEISALRELLQ